MAALRTSGRHSMRRCRTAARARLQRIALCSTTTCTHRVRSTNATQVSQGGLHARQPTDSAHRCTDTQTQMIAKVHTDTPTSAKAGAGAHTRSRTHLHTHMYIYTHTHTHTNT